MWPGKAAAAAIVFPARCHYWQRPLPIIFPSAANRKSVAFFPLRCGLVLICCRLFPLIPAATVGKREVIRAVWLFVLCGCPYAILSSLRQPYCSEQCTAKWSYKKTEKTKGNKIKPSVRLQWHEHKEKPAFSILKAGFPQFYFVFLFFERPLCGKSIKPGATA